MASKMTSRGTPFSLATASTTSNSSLLIFYLLRTGRLVGRRLVVGFGLVLARAMARLGLGRTQAQGRPVGNQAGLVDVVGAHGQFGRLAVGALDAEGDLVPVHAHDARLEAAAAVLRQLQRHLGRLACEARELRRGEQQIGRASCRERVETW